ncbi:MAG: metallophosphoesterase family protein [Clostridia bacterium]|nr:metallophosphoesterase family protein [Clostridia bacterium]
MKKRFIPEALTLTIYNRDATAYGVSFMTDSDVASFVQFADEGDTGFKNAKSARVSTRDYEGKTHVTAVMEGLAAGKNYLWRVGCGSDCSEKFKMKTVDTDSDSLTFTVYSDSQDRKHFGKWWRGAWQDAKERFPDAALCLHGGDVVENGKTHDLWVRALKYNKGLFTSMPMLPVTGNHDHMTAAGDVTHRYFNISPPADKKEPLLYYSVDVGPVHFTMLSSGDYGYTERQGLNAEQIEWAKRDIASSDKKWKVVMIHTPFYSPGKYGSHPENAGQPTALRRQLNEAFAKLGVDMVFTGHDHVFSETYPITADGRAEHTSPYVIKKINGEYYRLAVSPKGPIHIESGCTGNQNRAIECGAGLDEVSAGYFKDIVETPRGCVGYIGVRISGGVLTADYVLKRVSDGEDVIVRRFGIKK